MRTLSFFCMTARRVVRLNEGNEILHAANEAMEDREAIRRILYIQNSLASVRGTPTNIDNPQARAREALRAMSLHEAVCNRQAMLWGDPYHPWTLER